MTVIPKVASMSIDKEENKLIILGTDSNDNNEYSLLNGCKMQFDRNSNLTIIDGSSHYSEEEARFTTKGTRKDKANNISKGNTFEFDIHGDTWLAEFVGDGDLRDGYTGSRNRLFMGLMTPFSIKCNPNGGQGQGVVELRKT